MHRSPSPQARLFLSFLLSSVVAAAGCRGIQEPDSTQPTPDQPPTAGEVESVSQALAGVWTGVDIGATIPGTSSESNGTFTLEGGGADIWSTADAFRFHYMTVTGNVTLTARVVSVENTNAFAKVGVMMRETLAANAKNAFAVVTSDPANGNRLQYRTTAGGTTTKAQVGTGNKPVWLRLQRSGTTFTASFSTTSGTTGFTTIGTATISMANSIEVGLAVTSHTTAPSEVLATAVFNDVVFSPAQNPPGPPLAPGNVVATPGNNQVGLTWNASAGATSYTVQRSTTSGSGFTDRATGLTVTNFTDTTAVNGTQYFYLVRAVNSAGSTPSSEVTATPAPPPPPSAPTLQTATAGNAQVTLTWSAVAGASSYTVKRSLTAGGPYADFTAPGLTGTSYINTGLTNGTQYFYVVSATNSTGEGADSNERSATPQAPPAPGQVTGLGATGGNTQVSLSWSPVSGATSYTVKSGTTLGGPYPDVFSGIASTSFTHTGLTNGVVRYYRVSASNSGGEGPNSSEASATPTAPPPVTWTSKIIGTVASGATGSWSQNGTTHTLSAGGSDIYGTADNFRFTSQTINGDVTITARVQSLSNTNVWAKAVVMIRENDTAGARNVATVVSPTPTNKYRRQARTSAGGTSTSDPSTANSAIASWIRLQRVGSTFTSFHSSDGVSWTQIGTNTTLGIPASALVGLGVTSHTTTANTTATAVFTNVTVEVPAPPQAPAGLNGAGQNKQVHLTWNPSAGASSYIVKMATSASGPFNNVGTGVAVTQQTVTGLTNGTPYWFKVSASNPQGSSPDSASVMSTPTLLRPTVTSVAPASGSTGASPQQAFVSCDVQLPNVGGGVDIMTATPTTVILTRASDGTVVPTHYGTSGGADVLNTTPIDDLEPNTTYNFTLTDGLKDLTGAAFMPFSSSFTTGNNDPPPPTTIAFDQSEQTNTSSRKTWTSITLGPDNRIYAATITGQIYRFNVNTDGTLVNPPTLINTVRSSNGNIDRAVIGMAWDPAATSANLILWITHGGAALTGAPDWSGKLSKLTGSSLATYQDYVVNFPRSAKDHMTNSITFKGTDPNVIYITQGSMNAMGAPDNAWSLRKEHLLSAAILKVDLTKLPGTLPLDVKTNEDDETSQPGANGRYNPFAANVAVTIFATGVRNAYDLLWHSNGELYSSTNGSASGGSCPATPSPLPSACTRRIDQPTYGSYTGPSVPGISGNTAVEDDQLYRVVAGGYYGHPNPSRCEWVMNGGNPGDAPKKPGTGYSSTVQPDRNYRGNEFNFGIHFSPNGMIEWRANVFPTLVGRIMVIRYAGGDDIITLTVDPSTKGISGTLTAIPGFGGFDDPLDIIHNPANGNVYVTEHAGQRIFLLKPRP